MRQVSSNVVLAFLHQIVASGDALDFLAYQQPAALYSKSLIFSGST